MNIPKGYKQTELGIIPEDWEVVHLENLAKVNGRIGFRGYTVADLVHPGEGAYVIGGKHIANMTLDLSDAEYISWEKYFESPEIMIKQGDIVLAQRGTLGKSALIRNNIGSATINPSLVLINNIKCNNKYLSYWLQSDRIVKHICSINSQTSIPMITQKQIEHIPVNVPNSFPEQKAIAKALSDVDDLIAALDKKIAKKRLVKQGAMQQLLTGKKRLPGFTEEWVNVKLRDCFDIIAGGDIDIYNFSEVKTSNYKYPIYSNSLDNEGLYGYTSIPNYKSGCVTVTGRGTLGYAEYRSEDFDAIVRLIVMVPKVSNISGRYVKELLNLINPFIFESTGVPQLTVPQVGDTKIRVPHALEEQQAIVAILSDMDNEIANLEKQRENYCLLKSGMMQKLLTGQIRLK